MQTVDTDWGKRLIANTDIKIYGFFECPDGWRKLVEKLVTDLFAGGWDGELHQVKEKFGSLRFYTGGMSQACMDIVDSAEAESYTVCQDCGDPGVLRSGGWIRTLCDPCADRRKQPARAERS